jgi:hypothetical protein
MAKAWQEAIPALFALMIIEPARFDQRTITEPVANWFSLGLALFR